MFNICPRSLYVLIATASVIGCAEDDRSADGSSVTEVEASYAITRLCFRNEYPFQNDPDQSDVESLTLEVDGDRVFGEYHWLPAFKDRRLGTLEGKTDGQTITADYDYMQEGIVGNTTISIELHPDHAVIEAADPTLGLNANLVRVRC